MFRKMIIALFAVAAVGLVSPTMASARGGGHWGGGHGGFHGGGGGFRGAGIAAGAIGLGLGLATAPYALVAMATLTGTTAMPKTTVAAIWSGSG